MNYISAAEEYLRNYRHLKGSLGTMRRERGRLIGQAGPAGVNNMAMSIDAVGGGRGGGGEYDEAINLIWRIRELTENIKETEERLAEIDGLLDEISEGEGCECFGIVLRKWYIDKVPKERIGEEIGYQERNIYYLKAKAIRVFAIRMLGVRALEAI